MKRLVVSVFIFVCMTTVLSTPVRGTIMSINYSGDPHEAIVTWSFDYDLQLVTITETFYELEGYEFLLTGTCDSPSTFTVTKTITNKTGITWTGYQLDGTMGMGPSAYFVIGSETSTKLQTITYGPGVQFSAPPPVLDGESFTIQFDLYVPSTSGFGSGLSGEPVPEPATMVLFALGGLALMRSRRSAKAERRG